MASGAPAKSSKTLVYVLIGGGAVLFLGCLCCGDGGRMSVSVKGIKKVGTYRLTDSEILEVELADKHMRTKVAFPSKDEMTFTDAGKTEPYRLKRVS